jgi:hypothetical protein
MPQYLVAVYHPDDYDPSVETEATIEEIHALNRELIAAGARKFACGLSPAGNAKSLRAQPDGKVLVTDGPYTEKNRGQTERSPISHQEKQETSRRSQVSRLLFPK